MGLLACSLVVSLATVAWAGIPDLDLSSADYAATGTQVSVYSLPNAAGDPLNDVYVLGGAKVDATITLTLVDSTPTPIFNYPFEDMWLESDTPAFVFCPGGTTADANTDANGQTTFSGALFAGSWGAGAVIVINGDALTQAPLDFLFNSPDMDGSLVVNLTDVVLFAGVYYGAYEYAADFYWDGVINLSDIVLLAQGQGATCP
jgi:hypothetical protein